MSNETNTTHSEIEELVPDPKAAAELGTSLMGMWRRDHDPNLDPFWPARIKIRNRNHRSRLQLEAYKRELIRRGVTRSP
jgi:hypothetical protein